MYMPHRPGVINRDENSRTDQRIARHDLRAGGYEGSTVTDVGRICSAEGSETNIVASVFEDGQGEFVRRCRLSAQFAEVASCKIDAWHKANLSI